MYHVKMSFAMLAALVDIASGYEGEDSSRHDSRTTAALRRRGLINDARLTLAGRAYLSMAKYEVQTAQRVLREVA